MIETTLHEVAGLTKHGRLPEDLFIAYAFG
jgi:hypothetical protein